MFKDFRQPIRKAQLFVFDFGLVAIDQTVRNVLGFMLNEK